MNNRKLTFMVIMGVMVAFSMSIDSVTYAGWTITQLTNNDTNDEWPAISGSKVVWQGSDGQDSEIYCNYGSGQLTDNDVEDIRPDISGDNVVWQQNYNIGNQMTRHIMSNFDGDLSSDYMSFSPPMFFHWTPKISGTNVIWISSWYYDGYNNNYNVFSNFGGQLSFNSTINQIWALAISGNIAVWIEQPESGPRIINSNILAPISTYFGSAPDIDGTNVVWVSPSPANGIEEIYYNFGGSNVRLTSDSTPDRNPRISGTNIVWQRGDGAAMEIFTNFAGQVTNNSFVELYPDISGTTVVWQGWDGTDYEIYMATYSTNSSPNADAGDNQTIEATEPSGAAVALDGSGSTDDGQIQSLTYAWTWTGGSVTGINPTVTLPLGTTIVTLTVCDGEFSDKDTIEIQIGDATPPEISIDAPEPYGLYAEGDLVFDFSAYDLVSGNIEYPDLLGTLTDAAGFSGTVEPGDVPGVGVYNLSVSAVDEAGNTADAMALFVVYNPSDGFVTGGGWIWSPQGELPYMNVEGRANFGFVSKYKKGASEPTGQTEFVFQAGDLYFHSSSYDWLVVNQAGSNAQFKGSGTINGEGDYKFMLWAGDDNPDTFRIKIWVDSDEDNPVYDNGFNQVIGGGSIQIHTN